MENCYAKGNRIAEVDFTFTEDGELVCSHEFGAGFKRTDKSGPLTKEVFLTGTLDGGFTTMCADDLAAFMREHTDLYVVTDIKSDNVEGTRYLAERYPDLKDRFIIQIYHENEYEPVRALGFDYIIWTLYRTVSDERSLPQIRDGIVSHDLVGVTFMEKWMDGLDKWEGEYVEADWMKGEEFFEMIKALRVPACVHTVNDPDDMEKDYLRGVSVIYTDNVSNERFK